MEIKIVNNMLEEIEGITHEYPYVMHRVEQKNFYVPWHWHEEVEFCYVAQNGVEVTTPNKVYTFHKGEGFFTNTNVLCTMKALSSNEIYVMDSHLFNPVFLGGHYKSIFFTKYLEPVLKNTKVELAEFRKEDDIQRQILKRLMSLSSLQSKKDMEFQIRNEFSEIWLLLMKDIKNLEQKGIGIKPVSQERIQTMMTFIHLHYPEKLSLDDIAASALVSRRECLRCFQNCIRKSPFEYLTEYRIQAAETLLRTTDDTITKIALQTGFSNSAYFGKIFKQITQMTPQEYRREHNTQNHK